TANACHPIKGLNRAIAEVVQHHHIVPGLKQSKRCVGTDDSRRRRSPGSSKPRLQPLRPAIHSTFRTSLLASVCLDASALSRSCTTIFEDWFAFEFVWTSVLETQERCRNFSLHNKI